MKSKKFYIDKASDIFKQIEHKDAIAANGKLQENWHAEYKDVHLKTISVLEHAGFNSFAQELIKSSIFFGKHEINQRPPYLYSNYIQILREFIQQVQEYLE